MPLSLSDDELAVVMDCAKPLPPRDRDQFLRDVAAELEKHRELLGPGIVGRVEAQKRYLSIRPVFMATAASEITGERPSEFMHGAQVNRADR